MREDRCMICGAIISDLGRMICPICENGQQNKNKNKEEKK